MNLRLFIIAGRKDFAATGEIVQANLEKIGIRVELAAMEWGTMVYLQRAGDFELSLTSWGTTPAGDPAYILEMNVRTTGDFNPGFSHQGLDELLTRGQTTFEPQERARIYNEVQEILRAENPLLFLFHRVELTGMRDAVQGLEVHPVETYILHKDIYLN